MSLSESTKTEDIFSNLEMKIRLLITIHDTRKSEQEHAASIFRKGQKY